MLYHSIVHFAGEAFNYADRVGAVKIAFVAPDEWSKGLVRIKELARNYS